MKLIPFLKSMEPYVFIDGLISDFFKQGFSYLLITWIIKYMDEFVIIDWVVINPSNQLINSNDIVLDILPAIGNESESRVLRISDKIPVVTRIFSK